MGVAIGQEADRSCAALSPVKRRRYRNVARIALNGSGFFSRVFRRLPARGQNRERYRYKERSCQGPRSANVRPGQR